MGKSLYPPGPTSKFSIGIYLDLHRDPLAFLKRMVETYGDFVHLQLGSRHDFLVNDPEDVKKVLLSPEKFIRSTPRALSRMLGNGLLTSDQKFHGCQRRFLQPSFNPPKIAEYAPVMAKLAQELSQSWEGKEIVDIAAEMNDLALNVVVRTLLGTKLDEQEAEIIEAIETIKSQTDKKTMPFLDELLWKLPLPRNKRYLNAGQRLDKKIYEVIERKRCEGSNGGDLIASLLRAQGEENGKGVWTDKQIRDEAMTMFLAGHETIGSAMTWTWFLLSQNPNAEAKMHAELNSVLGKNPPQEKDIKNLIYTERVLLESMRLYPPVWLMVRKPTEDVELNGYTIPAGAYVHVCQYLLHRDARYFVEPQRFDPDRWSPQASAGRPKFSYFPFGGGKRQCIGEGFAMTEGILALAAIGQQWQLRRADDHTIEIESLITLRPKNGLKMKLEKRIK